ncbi:hypothetical protein [Marinicrinis sediminis]|uniref:Uncharacterized protein n=1 Tax=Marinicrinis sediminis TaxID=1652465 RepID=A0ABW5RC76_9BACL
MEKNILAYFKTPEEAEGLMRKLQALRAADVRIDRFSKYPGGGGDRVMNTMAGNDASIGNLTSDASFTNPSAGILSAIDPSVSGMSDGSHDGPTGRDVLLTAVMPEATFHQALQLVEQSGGLV